jgi:hypothetical protein
MAAEFLPHPSYSGVTEVKLKEYPAWLMRPVEIMFCMKATSAVFWQLVAEKRTKTIGAARHRLFFL